MELYDSHSVQCNEYKKVQHLPKNRHFTLRCYNKLLLFSTNQSQVHNILKSWGFSPRSAEMLFGPRASLPVFWNCASVLWGVQLLLRDPSSCSSTWWSCHRHPRRYPPQKQAGASGPWLSSWRLLLGFFLLFLFGSPHSAAARPPVQLLRVWSEWTGDAERESSTGWPTEPLADWLLCCAALSRKGNTIPLHSDAYRNSNAAAVRLYS